MKKRTFAALLILALAAASFTGCGEKEEGAAAPAGSAAEKESETAAAETTEAAAADALAIELNKDGLDTATKVTIGYNSTTWMWAVDQEMHFFEDEFAKYGIEVEWQLFDSGAAEKEAMATNNLDFGTSGIVPVVTIGASDLPVKVLAKYNLDPAYIDILVPAGSDIKEVADLKGKTIACPIGTAEYGFLLIALQNVGLTAEDVEIVNMAKTEHVTALSQNSIEATCTSGPHNLTAINDGIATSILNSEGVFNNTAYIIASEEFVENNPTIAAIFLKAWTAEMDYINQDMEAALDIVVEYTGAERESLVYGLSAEYDTEVTDFDKQSLEDIMNMFYETGQIENTFDTDSIYDFSYLERANEL
ncbi:MAG: aliphatic sulfonate ABC transporter substrate-binding protein [Roseburia sp.]|nr:aliphatic sulfonate ABC transporter substrate-binding protein [Roseburia sp.]